MRQRFRGLRLGTAVVVTAFAVDVAALDRFPVVANCPRSGCCYCDTSCSKRIQLGRCFVVVVAAVAVAGDGACPVSSNCECSAAAGNPLRTGHVGYATELVTALDAAGDWGECVPWDRRRRRRQFLWVVVAAMDVAVVGAVGVVVDDHHHQEQTTDGSWRSYWHTTPRYSCTRCRIADSGGNSCTGGERIMGDKVVIIINCGHPS